MSRTSKPKPDAKPATPPVAPPVTKAATPPVTPVGQDSIPAEDQAVLDRVAGATNTESTLGDGDAKGAGSHSPQGSTAPEAPAPDVVNDPDDNPPAASVPEDWVPVAFVGPEELGVEIAIESAVQIDGMDLKPGRRAVLKPEHADDLVKAGAARWAEDAA